MPAAIVTLGPSGDISVAQGVLGALDHLRRMGSYVTQQASAQTGDTPDFHTADRPAYDGVGTIEVSVGGDASKMLVTIEGEEPFVAIMHAVCSVIIGKNNAGPSDPHCFVVYLPCILPEVTTTFGVRTKEA